MSYGSGIGGEDVRSLKSNLKNLKSYVLPAAPSTHDSGFPFLIGDVLALCVVRPLKMAVLLLSGHPPPPPPHQYLLHLLHTSSRPQLRTVLALDQNPPLCLSKGW